MGRKRKDRLTSDFCRAITASTTEHNPMNLAKANVRRNAKARAEKDFIDRVTTMQAINAEGYEDYKAGDSFNPGGYKGEELAAYQSGWDRAVRNSTI
jgi:hypothetical protein